jgi:AraC-like DNA-binding protein
MEHSVFRSLEIIENRITEKLTVANIANGVHFSKYHYQRIFRDAVGESVMGYVTKRKLTLAGKMLLETRMSVLDIALAFGFDSHEGFTRSFKAYMGVTPTLYRRYGLSSISQKNMKGRMTMKYSKNTDEIIRKMNDFVAKAKELASEVKRGDILEYQPFWQLIAGRTEEMANRAMITLERVASIAEHPDEITQRFSIIKIIEDITFESNLIAFNVGLTVHRGQPEHVEAQSHYCDKFRGLAMTAFLSVGEASLLFNELSALIFDDMRKTAAEKINTVVQKARDSAKTIAAYSGYIKHEIESLAQRLASIPAEEIKMANLEDVLFQLNILIFAAEIDVTRNPGSAEMVKSMAKLRESLYEAVEFILTLAKPEPNPVIERDKRRVYGDFAFQGNILLFYLRGEMEKAGVNVDAICDKINAFIQFIQKADDDRAYKEIPAKIHEAADALQREVDKLNEQGCGGAFNVLAGELKGLANRATEIENG